MNTRTSHRRRRGPNIARRSEQGQSIVEFALIVPFLFLMLAGIAVIAQGLNLQMIMFGAAYEGARVWAKNPAGGDISHCIRPACDPDSGSNNFKMYVEPVVRQYVTNNGYDGGKVIFFNKDETERDKVLSVIAADAKKVEVLALYPYELPVGIFAEGYQQILIGGRCSMKRGG